MAPLTHVVWRRFERTDGVALGADRMVYVLAIVFLGAASAMAQTPDMPWEFTPYRIRALVTMPPDWDARGAVGADLADDLQRWVDVEVGAPWDFTATLATPRQRMWILRAVDGQPSVPPEPADFTSETTAPDKLIVVSVSPAGNRWRIEAREFDFRVRSWRPVIAGQIDQIRRAPGQIFAAVWKAFSPVAKVERTEAGEARLFLQASQLPYRDAELSSVNEGDVFEPFLRRTGRGDDPAAANVAVIPWTYLTMTQVRPEAATAQIQSGGRSPLSTTLRGGTEIVAIAARATTAGATLSLRSAEDGAAPLVGYEVGFQSARSGNKITWIGVSGETGQINLPAVEGPLATLYVRHGENLVARLPYAPGLHDQLAVRLPDDTAWATAQAAASGLFDQLMDTVVQREILVAQIRRRIERNELDEARDELQSLRKMPRRDVFDRSVVQLRQRAAVLSPAAKQAFEQQLDAILQAAGEHLDALSIDRLQQELDKATAPP